MCSGGVGVPRDVRCPNCGFQFNVLYARAVTCKGCDKLFLSPSCEYVKCPKCGTEFKKDVF